MRQEQIYLSIIIPIYNTAKYLPACLDSILKQTNDEVEIICINDGSTDSSLKILEKYKAKSNNFHIINQENKGIGYSRNKGLSIAKGKYILFIDSDDWVNENLLSTIFDYTKKTDCDIFCFNAQIFDNKLQKLTKETFFNPKQINPSLPRYGVGTHRDFSVIFYNNISSVNKAYKKDFLLKQDIYFPEDLYFEDWIFHHKSFFNATKIAFFAKPLYYYRVNQTNSFVGKMKKNRSIFDLFAILEEYKTILLEANLYEHYRANYENYMVWILKVKFVSDVHFKLKKEFLERTKLFLKENITNLNNNSLLYASNLEFIDYINNFNWLVCWFIYYSLNKLQTLTQKQK